MRKYDGAGVIKCEVVSKGAKDMHLSYRVIVMKKGDVYLEFLIVKRRWCDCEMVNCEGSAVG